MNSAGISSQSELARQSGIPQPTINRILHRPGRRGPATDTLRKLAVACGVSFQWLADGADTEQGVIHHNEPTDAIPEPGNRNGIAGLKSSRLKGTAEPVQIRQVKLMVSAGSTDFSVLAQETAQESAWLDRKWLRRRGYDGSMLIALAMVGESMAPALYAGDTVVVNLADTQPRDGEVFVVNYEGTVLIRRLVRNAHAWWLCADSADQRRFRRKQYTGAQCAIVGRLVYKLSEKI